jgi:hypothetical protein
MSDDSNPQYCETDGKRTRGVTPGIQITSDGDVQNGEILACELGSGAHTVHRSGDWWWTDRNMIASKEPISEGYEFRTYIDTPDAGPVRMGACRKCGALVEMDFASREASTLHTQWHEAQDKSVRHAGMGMGFFS